MSPDPPAPVAHDAVPSLAHTLQGAPYEPPLVPGQPDFDLHEPATSIDPKDKGTPDDWVPRDPRLVRLTGRHPLNCEPPMHTLMEHGFITPESLMYVRNHGKVPQLDWRAHRVKVHGLVNTPLELSMDELLDMPSVTLPVTTVCSGNRRKEVNMVKKSKGYNWGACAVATTYWTGVRLRDLLLKAGAKAPEEGAQYVRVNGAKGEVPKGDGIYGTSITFYKAMDEAADVLLAFKQNGRWLTPDHGFPCRLLIPGYISGRMVKWVADIEVSDKESSNFYHHHDNRALPSEVDEQRAEAEGWLTNPDVVINNLNINSAISQPWHDKVVPLKGDASHTFKGYAYAGDGKKVIRVEVSLDEGGTWRQANIRRFEKPTSHGKFWCWVHWDLDLAAFDLLQCREVVCRAWDEDMNTQPSAITWNLMGMMNNCMYKVKVAPTRMDSGAIGLRFQHPAPVELGEHGSMGWREEDNIRQQAIAAAMSGRPASETAAAPATPPRAPGRPDRAITAEEVAKHSSEGSAWFIRDGCVYDATPFLGDHPGGAESILLVAGTDASDEFNAIHSAHAKKLLQDYYIGRLAPPGAPGAAEDGAAAAAAQPATTPPTPAAPAVLNARDKVTLPLAEKIIVTHNTRIFRFALPSPQHRLGLPCGKHVFAYATLDGEAVVRPYTPISSDDDLGHMDLLIKVYFAGTNPNHPPGGKMSQFMDKLSIGDTMSFKGPVGQFVYEGRGAYTVNRQRGCTKHLSLVAGGTGITPIYSVMQKALKEPQDTTTMSLLFGNISEDDILLQEQLEAMVNNHPDRVRVYHVITHAPPGWQQGSGFITLDMMKERLFPAGPDSLALMCGPPGLLNHVCLPGFKAMGYEESRMVVF